MNRPLRHQALGMSGIVAGLSLDMTRDAAGLSAVAVMARPWLVNRFLGLIFFSNIIKIYL